MVRSSSEGMALPLVLLLLLALTAFGHGALLLSRRELKASWAFRELIRASQAAEIGLRLGWERPIGAEDLRRPGTVVQVVSGETDGGLTYQTSRRWLNEEFFLLESEGGLRGWEGERDAAWIGWTLHPERRITSFLGAVEVGQEVRRNPGAILLHGSEAGPGAGVHQSTPSGTRQGLCESWSLPLQGPLLRSQVDSSGQPALSRIPSLGLLDGAEILARVLDPVPLGEEETDEEDCWNRGRRPAARGSWEDVVVEEESECGLLVAGGDLRLENKVSFQGLALVGGDLIVDKGSTFEGMAKVGGALILRRESRFVGSPCHALWALEGVPAMKVPLFVKRGNYNGGT